MDTKIETTPFNSVPPTAEKDILTNKNSSPKNIVRRVPVLPKEINDQIQGVIDKHLPISSRKILEDLGKLPETQTNSTVNERQILEDLGFDESDLYKAVLGGEKVRRAVLNEQQVILDNKENPPTKQQQAVAIDIMLAINYEKFHSYLGKKLNGEQENEKIAIAHSIARLKELRRSENLISEKNVVTNTLEGFGVELQLREQAILDADARKIPDDKKAEWIETQIKIGMEEYQVENLLETFKVAMKDKVKMARLLANYRNTLIKRGTNNQDIEPSDEVIAEADKKVEDLKKFLEMENLKNNFKNVGLVLLIASIAFIAEAGKDSYKKEINQR